MHEQWVMIKKNKKEFNFDIIIFDKWLNTYILIKQKH